MENYIVELKTCEKDHIKISFGSSNECPLCSMAIKLKEVEDGLLKLQDLFSEVQDLLAE